MERLGTRPYKSSDITTNLYLHRYERRGPLPPKEQSHTCGIKVNHLPSTLSKCELKERFRQYGKIWDVRMGQGGLENYAFINYASLAEARRAATAMNRSKVYGAPITVRVQGESSTSSGKCTVKVTYLVKDIDEATLEDFFSFSGELSISSKLNSCDDPFNYAYVNYTSPEDAERAVRELDGRRISGGNIKVKLHDSGSASNSPFQAIPGMQQWQPFNVNSPQRGLHPFTEPPHLHQLPAQRGLHPFTEPPQLHQLPAQRGLHPLTEPPQLHQLPAQRGLHPLTEPPQLHQLPAQCGLHPFTEPPQLSARETSTLLTYPQVIQSIPPQQQSVIQSGTVKVSLQGDLHSDDLHEIFSRFGTIPKKPVIYQGTPNFAYINYMCPQEAQAACTLNGTEIKGIRIQVKISQKKGASNQDCKLLPCDPLIARLLTSQHKEEVDKIAKQWQVSFNRMKTGNGINLWGESAALENVKAFINLLIEKIQEEIKSCSFTLPCVYIPLFRNQEIFSRVEEKHGVEFIVTGSSKPQGEVTINDFQRIVSNHFSGGTSSSIPQVSLISDFLVTPAAADQTEKLWFWEDDSGGYTPYTPDICSTLNKQFAGTPKGSVPCVVTSRTYTINFANMTQINDETGTVRKIKCESGSPTWLCRNNQKQFVPYKPQDAAAIEKMYKSRLSIPHTMGGRSYTFVFATGDMRQINIETKRHRQVQRHIQPNTASIVKHELKLQVRGLQPSLQVVINELRQELDRHVITKEIDLPSNSDAAFHDSLLQMTNQYFISGDIARGKIELQGTQEYVERVALLVHKETLAYEKKLLLRASLVSGKVGEVPKHWDPQIDNVELKPVHPGTTEWNHVQMRMRETLPLSQIVQLDRIQNIWLWEMYSFSKQRMSEKNSGAINEKQLFHGTRSSPPEKIFKSEKGFDFRFASKGMWGEGTYFAVNASYSDLYAYEHSCGSKQMILATVLTGETCCCPCDRSLKKPPVKSKATSSKTETFADDYDSVSGRTKGSDIFVIYDHEKAYPTYLITYK